MKSFLRFSKANGTTRRKVEQIIRLGKRASRRQLNSGYRRALQQGGFRES